jgi:hypothetical protein
MELKSSVRRDSRVSRGREEKATRSKLARRAMAAAAATAVRTSSMRR